MRRSNRLLAAAMEKERRKKKKEKKKTGSSSGFNSRPPPVQVEGRKNDAKKINAAEVLLKSTADYLQSKHSREHKVEGNKPQRKHSGFDESIVEMPVDLASSQVYCASKECLIRSQTYIQCRPLQGMVMIVSTTNTGWERFTIT